MGNLTIPARVCYSDKLILTTEQLAEFYETDPRRISENFNRNEQYFTEGKHYFKLEGDALKDFKKEYANCLSVGLRTPLLYLWTKQGAARHAKILTTEKAWAVYELLEENYFTPKEKPTVATTDFAAVLSSTTSAVPVEKRLEMLLEFAKLTTPGKLRNQFLREAAELLTGKKF